jgi:hypothetical protein
MSTDPTGGASGPAGAPGAGAAGQPSEEEMRAAYEAELSRITTADMMLQAAVTLLNIGSYRLAPGPAGTGAGEPGAPPPGRDLEQARDAIDGVRALLEILERSVPNEIAPLRNALSQLQMAYAREAQTSGAETGAPQPAAGPPQAQPTGAAGGETEGQPSQPGPGEAPDEQGSSGPGPAESSGRLWVPGR